MDAQTIKEYIMEHDYVETVLESIQCHHIAYHSSGNPDPFWTCANKDGNNIHAICVYKNESLKCINYTRDMTGNKDLPTDIISLVCYNENLSFSQALKYICELLKLDFYQDEEETIPQSLLITRLIFNMASEEEIIEEKPLKPISEKVLSYYSPYVNDLFYNDGINYETQQEFEIAYDAETNRIVIPIRDECNSLIGCKGRLFKQSLEENELKYIYIEPCARSKILYGLYKTYPYIKNQGKVYVGESEKFVMQLWSMGIYNCVATSGKKISHNQIEKLTRLGVDIVLCFDKDVTKEEIKNIADRFIDGVSIEYLFDEDNILNEKESPSDNHDNFKYMLEHNLYKIQ